MQGVFIKFNTLTFNKHEGVVINNDKKKEFKF